MTVDDFTSDNARTQLRSLDRLLISNNSTVRDLLEQAIVVAGIVDESEEKYLDLGPLELMFNELQLLRTEMNMLLQNKTAVGFGESNPYQNVTWADSTNSSNWYNNPFTDPLRHYPQGYAWDDYAKKVVKVTSGSGI